MRFLLGIATFLLCIPAYAKGTIEAATGDLIKDLAAVPKGALVVSAPLETDVACTNHEELAKRVSVSLAAKLSEAHVHPAPLSLSAASRIAMRYPALVYVSATLKKGALAVTVDAQVPTKNAWDRLRHLVPPPFAHAFVSKPIDPEVQHFLTPIVLEQAHVTKFTHEEGTVLGAACGDLDGDGGLEIAISTREKIVLGRLRGKRFQSERSVLWASLGKRLPIPMRDPLSRITVGAGTLAVGSSTYGSYVLSSSLEKTTAFVGMPLWWDDTFQCAGLVPDQGALESTLRTCDGQGTNADGKLLPSTLFDHAGMWPGEVPVHFTHEPSGKFKMRRNGRLQTLENANTGGFVTDLDLDGLPELVFSTDTTPENIVVYTWKEDSVVERKKLPTSSPLQALAACPAEQDGKPGFVAVFGSEVWLVR